MNIYKEKITIHDAKGHRAELDIAVREGQDKKLFFTVSGQYQDSCGKCLDNLEPTTGSQEALIDLWNKFNLKEVDKDFITDLKILVEELETQENEYQDKPITEKAYECVDEVKEAIDNWLERNPKSTIEKILAICAHFDIGLAQLDDVDQGLGYCHNIEGQDYLVCTDEEADEENEEVAMRLIDDIEPEHFYESKYPKLSYKDGWLTVNYEFDFTDRGQNLNTYDGNEYYETIMGEDIYLYKR